MTSPVNARSPYVRPVPSVMIRFGEQLRKDSLTLICYHQHTRARARTHMHAHARCFSLHANVLSACVCSTRSFNVAKNTASSANTPSLLSQISRIQHERRISFLLSSFSFICMRCTLQGAHIKGCYWPCPPVMGLCLTTLPLTPVKMQNASLIAELRLLEEVASSSFKKLQ